MARVRVGSAEINLTLLTGQFTRGVESVRSGVDRMKQRFADFRADLNTTSGQLRLFAGATATGFAIKQIFELGTAVEETAAKFNTVFGDAAGGVNDALSEFSSLAGLSAQKAQELTATTGAVVQGMGFSQRASADFAVEIQKLAADLGSFNNIPVAETSRAIQAALTGEREQLKRLGVVIRETDVQQRAMANSGKTNARALTDQEKALATYQLIVERAGVAVGDLVRTQESAAARGRDLQAELENLRNRIAEFLLPVIGFLAEKFNNLIDWIEAAGAQAAVFGGQIELLVAKMKFWDKEGIQAATANLDRLKDAASEVKDSIAGLVPPVGDVAGGMARVAEEAAGSGGGAAGALREVGVRTIEAATSSEWLGNVTIHLATNLRALAGATNEAAAAQERLNSARSKFNSIVGAVGFLSRLGPLSFLSGPVGTIAGAVGAFQGLQGAFSTQNVMSAQAPGEMTMNIRVHNLSDRTVQSIRGRMSHMDNLDIPVVP